MEKNSDCTRSRNRWAPERAKACECVHVSVHVCVRYVESNKWRLDVAVVEEKEEKVF